MARQFPLSRTLGVPSPGPAPAEKSPPLEHQPISSDPAPWSLGERRPLQLRGQGSTPGADPHQVAAAGLHGPASPLPHLDQIQASFGHHNVRNTPAHQGPAAAAASKSLGAKAYTTDGQVAFGETADLHTAAHEAAHIVQQRGGVHLKGGLGQPGDSWEQHADKVADRVVRGESAERLLDPYAPPGPLDRGHSGAGVIQRDVKEVPTSYKRYADLEALTLNDMKSYTIKQLDWANSPDLTDPQRDKIWRWMELAQNKTILASCGSLKVGDLEAKVTTEEHVDQLKNYGFALAGDAGTVSLKTLAPDATTALSWGTALGVLEDKVPGSLLHNTVLDEQFRDLVKANEVKGFSDYYETVKPILNAENGEEVVSYLEMKGEGTNYKGYQAALPDVRNIHRFEEAALKQLDTNAKDKSKTKYVNLILHTALDHNGAFHRDPNLTTVITDTRNLALMIEGVDSLSAIQGRIPGIATTWSKGDKIDQVMIAGHGNAQKMELAGSQTRKGSGVKTRQEDLAVGDSDSSDLLAEILKVMDKGTPHHRVVFNACLTNSNAIPMDQITEKDPVKAAKQVRDYIDANPSLATSLNKATGGDIKGIGANASISQVSLMDPKSGELDIQDKDDPRVTAPKLEYVVDGFEPLGVMRAVVESWATDVAACRQAMQSRVVKGTRQWRDPILTRVFQIVVAKYMNDVGTINTFTEWVGRLGEAQHKDECSVPRLSPPAAIQADAEEVIVHMLAAIDYTARGNPYTPLVLYLVMMGWKPAFQVAFLTQLSNVWFNCQTADEFLPGNVINPYLDQLLAVNDAACARGKLLLALLGVARGVNNQTCKDYLVAHGVANAALKAEATQLLQGKVSDQVILVAIGVRAAGGAVVVAPNADVDANVGGGAGTNTSYFIPVQGQTRAAKGDSDKRVKLQPDAAAGDLGMLAKGTRVPLLGHKDPWFAIKFEHKVGYVHKQDMTA